jgi:hypothetical protein
MAALVSRSARLWAFVLLGLMGCASGPAKDAPAEKSQTSEQSQVDFSRLFDVHTSLTLFDDRIAPKGDAGLMKVVLLGPGILDANHAPSTAEPWLRRMLLAELGRRGSIVRGPAPPTEWSADGVCPLKGCEVSESTVWLRGLSLRSGENAFPLVVKKADDGSFVVHHRPSPNAPSECGAISAKLNFVEMRGTAQRTSDQAVAAHFAEMAVVAADLPRPFLLTHAAGDLCGAIERAFTDDKRLDPTEFAFQKAAAKVFDAALGSLYGVKK